MNELQERYAYLATLLSRLYPHSQVTDPGQRRERAIDYCEMRQRWETLNPQNPGVNMGLLDALGLAIKAKADKWGVAINWGPAEGPVVPNACVADTLTPNISVLDDILGTTGALASNLRVILPILVVLNLLSNMPGILSLIGGRRRR